MSNHEDRANIAGSRPASDMCLRHFEYGDEKFLTWDGAHRRWLSDGKRFNVYEVFDDGTFYKVLARSERTP